MCPNLLQSRPPHGLDSGWALALLAGTFLGCSEEIPPPAPIDTVVRVTSGELQGERLEGEPVHVFRGIPYAAPPTGERRWRPPQPAAAWNDTRPALEFGPTCIQPTASGFYAREEMPQSEDCLTLNLWTAAETTEDRRPVMVWIHGGSLTSGTGRTSLYDGATLAREGAVVVTLNYRLNAFGFLAHPALSAESEHGSSSHYGILDQIAALRWVRDNIAAFGGDPSRVTIFGESAGSKSVSILLATPLARGLFHRAIGQSGAAFLPLHPLRGEGPRSPSAEAIGERFAATLGIEDPVDSAAAMRRKPAEEILEAFSSDPLFSTYWALTPVDGWVLPAQLSEIFARGEQTAVPVIAGTTADEGTVFVDYYFSKKWFASAAAYQGFVRASYGELADALLDLYPASSDDEARDALARLVGDDLFTFPTRALVRGMATVPADAYLYYFTRVPPIAEAEELGSFHAAEIPYVFGTKWPGDGWGDVDEKLSRTLRSAWLRFAATGDPNGVDLPEWTAFTAANEAYMEFGDRVTVGSRLRVEEIDTLARHYRQMLDSGD